MHIFSLPQTASLSNMMPKSLLVANTPATRCSEARQKRARARGSSSPHPSVVARLSTEPTQHRSVSLSQPRAATAKGGCRNRTGTRPWSVLQQHGRSVPSARLALEDEEVGQGRRIEASTSPGSQASPRVPTWPAACASRCSLPLLGASAGPVGSRRPAVPPPPAHLPCLTAECTAFPAAPDHKLGGCVPRFGPSNAVAGCPLRSPPHAKGGKWPSVTRWSLLGHPATALVSVSLNTLSVFVFCTDNCDHVSLYSDRCQWQYARREGDEPSSLAA